MQNCCCVGSARSVRRAHLYVVSVLASAVRRSWHVTGQSPCNATRHRTTRHLEMSEFDSRQLLVTESVSVWNVVCPGRCRHESVDESAETTHLVFPYRAVYVHHVGGAQTVAQANQVVFLNENEPYRVSHPVAGGRCDRIDRRSHANVAEVGAWPNISAALRRSPSTDHICGLTRRRTRSRRPLRFWRPRRSRSSCWPGRWVRAAFERRRIGIGHRSW
jgi:hypothetical protein